MSSTTCHVCGITHPLVEAGGIYYCPNRLCKGCGAWSHRSKLKSFTEHEGGKHSVDPCEMLEYVRANTHQDPVIAAAEARSTIYWETLCGLSLQPS